MVLALLITLAIIALGVGLYLQHPKFGRAPEGSRLERMNNSPNYVDGKFQNLVPTPVVIQERSSRPLSFFAERERLRPPAPIPTVKTDLKTLDKGKDVFVWFGHASYFMQLGGKQILVDPVFSPYASPVPFINKAFEGTNLYTAEDMPEIDYLLISHDHWDHLDYPTIMALKPKIKNVVCGLGVGSYFEQWGFEEKLIHEAVWNTKLQLENDLIIHVLSARHYSGRLLSKDKTLWVGYALITPERRVFLSGDSGYGPHFKEIGALFNGFDLAILDNGQYDKNWPYIHMMPEEVVQATEDLKAKSLVPGHSGKFAIANHPWDEPVKRITDASRNKNFRLLTPMIGESVDIENQKQVFSRWWERVE